MECCDCIPNYCFGQNNYFKNIYKYILKINFIRNEEEDKRNLM